MAERASVRVADRRKAVPGEHELLTGRRLHTLAMVAIAASVAGMFFALPHTTEDFVYHVPRSRFHLNDEFSLWLWAAVSAVQVAGIAMAAARNRAGFALIALTGVIWMLASVLDHTGDVFRHQPWRDAPSSTIWVTGTALASLAAAAAGVLVVVAWRTGEARVGDQTRRPRDPGLNG